MIIYSKYIIMIKTNLLSNNQKLLNLTSVNIFGSNLVMDTSINFRNNLFYINSNNRIGVLTNTPQYTLDIVGDINFTGNIYNNGTIVTTEQAAFSLWTNNSGYIFYNGGGVSIGTSSNPTPYILYINGTSYFVSQVNINDNLVVSGDITCQNINVSDTTTTNNLMVSGSTNVTGLTSSSAINTASLNVTSGDINITSGNIVGPGSTITCKDLIVTNQTSFLSNIIFLNNVSVLGTLTSISNFNVNNKFLVNGSSGNISTSGSIVVGNSLSVAGTLNVGGYTELSKVKINNDLDINGNLKVITGSTELAELTVDGITNLLSDIIVDSGNFVINTVTGVVTINYTTPSVDFTTGSLVVAGGVGIGRTLNVADQIISKSGQSEFVDLVVNNDFTANGKSEFNSDVNIYGKTTIYENLSCELPGGTITAVTGLNIGQSLGSPALKVDSMGNLDTIGDAQISGDVTIGGDVLVQGNLVLSGTAASFAGGLITNCRFIQDNLSTYDVYAIYSGSTFIIVDHTILNSIVLTSTPTIGTNYKFVMGPGFNAGTGLTVKITIQTSIPAINFFGIVDNAGTYLSISSSSTIITLNANAPGDFVDISGVYIDSSNNFGYYINAKSSVTNGFIIS